MILKKIMALMAILMLAGCGGFMPIKSNPPVAPLTCPEVKEQPGNTDNVTQPKPPADTAPKKTSRKPSTKATAAVKPMVNNALSDKAVWGRLEYTTIQPSGWRMKSRIDSGATTTSIDARDIRPFERDGKRWVRFKLVDRDSGKTFQMEKPVSRRIAIKRHNDKKQKRYVVKMDLAIGNVREKVEVSLVDRSNLLYPVLIGRNFMMDRAIVDVSKKYVANKPTF